MTNIVAFKDSYESPLKSKLKNLIYDLNYLEKKINYTERVVFYNFNIDGNQIYRFCIEEPKYLKLNKNNLRINCLKEGKEDNRIFYIQGNSHTANFIPMFNNININDTIYFNHKRNILENINFDQINNLKRKYKEVVFTTNIRNLESLNKLINIQKNFDQDVKILILGATPSVDHKIKPLKCFIQNKDCEFDTHLNRKNLKNVNTKIKQLINYNLNFNHFDPYNIICPDKFCKVYDKKKNLITHRDDSHLTKEGSMLMRESFLKFYKKTYKSD